MKQANSLPATEPGPALPLKQFQVPYSPEEMATVVVLDADGKLWLRTLMPPFSGGGWKQLT
jgi:hypothetical protein